MEDEMDTRTMKSEELIEQIIYIEWEMLRAVKTHDRSNCQDQPGTFRIMRWMSYSVLPENLLVHVLADLEAGQLAGRNFMTEKYARMDGTDVSGAFDVRIGEIVEIEVEWMAELSTRFPRTFPGHQRAFRNYMSAELRSYNGETVKLYHRAVCRAYAKHRNLAEERYTNLFRRLGYASIAEREAGAQ